jgi:hypothetical protein
MRLEAGMDLSDPLYDVLGYCDKTNKVRIGALAENTHPQIRFVIFKFLDKLEEPMLRTQADDLCRAKRH